MKNQWRLIAGIVLILLIIVFAVMNVGSVPVNFGFGKVTAPLIMVIFVSLLLGALLTLLVSTASSARTNREIRSLREKAAGQDKAVASAVEETKTEYMEKISELQNELAQKNEWIDRLQNQEANPSASSQTIYPDRFNHGTGYDESR